MWSAIETIRAIFIIIYEEFSNLKISSPLKFVTTQLLWNMEDMYGATMGFH
jgi:hypothetical protein